MKTAKTTFVAMAVIFSAAIACAETAGPKEPAARDTGTNIKDIMFGWTEIPKSVVQVTKETRNPLWGLTVGTLKGIGKAFPRTVSAVSQATSAPQGDTGKPGL